MALSRQEALAKIRDEAKRLEALALPLGPYLALYAWAVLIDETILDVQRQLSAEYMVNADSNSQQEWHNKQTRQALANMHEDLDRLKEDVRLLEWKLDSVEQRTLDLHRQVRYGA